MAYTSELRGLRQEVRLSTAGSLTFWPKVAGVGNVLASPTAGHCYYGLFDESGVQIQATANVVPTTVGSISKLVLSVDAIAVLGEEYSARVWWRQSGNTVEYADVEPFRVVRYPWVAPSVSLNTMLDDYPESAEILRRHGLKLGMSATGSTAEETMAAVYGYRALVELDRWVRGIGAPDEVARSGSGVAGGARARLHLVRNREACHLIERKLALKLMFRGDGGSQEGQDESSLLMRSYAAEAESEWRALVLRYDTAETGVPDTTIEAPGAVRILSRPRW